MPYHSGAMKRMLCFITASWVTFVVGFSPTGAMDSEYLWPLNGFKGLSSIFADYRHFHFHSGIDIPTGGKTGYEVSACQSGYVYRVFASWKGYGKAVYLKLDDGGFAVYGHLSAFSEKIAEVVEKEQLENRRYRTDLFLPEREIRVERGEVIGYSGESGWGGPHLHFELRDSANNPLNPLTWGLSVEDRIPPVMQYVAFRPLEVGAKVDGSTQPTILPLSFNSAQGTYRPDHAPVAEGEMGLEVSVYDKMDNSRFKFGVYRLELYLDDSLLFASRYDRISFETTHKIELDRDFELRKTRGTDFYKLYAEEGNDLTLYNPTGGKVAARSVRPDSHQVTIKAVDALGNVSLAVFPIIFDRAPVILSCSIENGDGEPKINLLFEDPDDRVKEIVVQGRSLPSMTWQDLKIVVIDKQQGEETIRFKEDWDQPALLRVKLKDGFQAVSEERYLSVDVDPGHTPEHANTLGWSFGHVFKDNTFAFDLEFDQVLTGLSLLSLESGAFSFDPLFCEQTDPEHYRVIFPFYLRDQKEMTLLGEAATVHGDTVMLKTVVPVAIITNSYGGSAVSSDGRARLEAKPNVVYGDINVNITATDPESEPARRPVGKIYSFEPSTIPLNGWADIRLSYPRGSCDPGRLGVYELAGENTWSYVGHDLDTAGGTVGGRVRYLSTYALLEDTLPPVVSRISIKPGARIKSRRPGITALITDDLSGTGEDDYMSMEIDGEWMISEYDVDNKILSTRPTLPLSLGKHILSVWARDRAGNETKKEREFSVVSK